MKQEKHIKPLNTEPSGKVVVEYGSNGRPTRIETESVRDFLAVNINCTWTNILTFLATLGLPFLLGTIKNMWSK